MLRRAGYLETKLSLESRIRFIAASESGNFGVEGDPVKFALKEINA